MQKEHLNIGIHYMMLTELLLQSFIFLYIIHVTYEMLKWHERFTITLKYEDWLKLTMYDIKQLTESYSLLTSTASPTISGEIFDSNNAA